MQKLSDNLHRYSEYIEPEILKALTDFLDSDDDSVLQNEVLSVADFLGSSRIMKALLSKDKAECDSAESKLLKSFHKNLHLLVQKTWVEKNDETVKEQLLVRLDKLCDSLTQKNYVGLYSEILSVLNSSVTLMFGENTAKEDFTNYALRIDPGFGVFWCFLKCLPEKAEWKSEKIRDALLLGMCFLANY